MSILDRHSSLDKNRISLITKIASVFVFLSFPYFFIFYFLGLYIPAYLVIPSVLLYLSCIGLNRLNFHNAAAFGIIFFSCIILFYYSCVLGKPAGAHYVFFSLAFLPPILFGLRQKKLLSIGFLCPVFTVLVLESTNYGVFHRLSNVYQGYITSLFATVTTFSIIVGSVFFYALSREKAESSLDGLNKELFEANENLKLAYNALQKESQKTQQAVHTAQDLSHRAALSTLTMGIAHEIRNPMGVLQGHLMLLADEFGGKRNETYNVDDETFNNQWGYHLTPEDFITDQLDSEGARAVFLYLQEKGYLTADGQLGEMFDNYNFAFPDLDLASHLESNRPRIVGRLRTAHHFSALYYFFNVSMLQFQRILKSVDGMLKYGISGKESGQALKKIDVSQVLNDCVSVLSGTAKRKGIVFQCEIPKSLPLIFGDDLRLHQAFFNMMFNAVQALEDLDAAKKSICVKIKPVRFKSLSGTVRKGLEVRLCDNGPGISSENLGKIFHPFFSTKSPTGGKNAGLGLSLVKEVISAHEGTVRVCSILNKGTLFKVRLPE